MSKKRKRDGGHVDVQLVEIYENLANQKETQRLQAVQSLLSKLDGEAELREKALKRLIRGLASSRKAARVGFSLALTEYLRLYAGPANGEQPRSPHLLEIVDFLEDSTKIGSDAKGQEMRDHWYGRLFGAAALIQAGVLFNGEPRTWKRILDMLLEAAKKKVWLREECGWLLLQAVHKLAELDVALSLKYAQALIDQLHAHTQEKTPEGVAIWIAVQERFPHAILPEHVFALRNPLAREEKSRLARILRQSSAPGEQNGAADETASTGIWFSKIHFAWQVVFDAAMKGNDRCIKFSDLWREAVDDGLFSSKASSERKYWGLLLFQKYVMSVPKDVVSNLFGPNLTRCLKNELQSEEKYLNTLALDVIDSIIARSLEDKDSIPAFIDGFLEADINFDRLARSKPVEKLLAQADIPGLQLSVRRIRKEIALLTAAVTSQDQHGLTSLADLLVSVVRTRAFPEEPRELTRYREIVDMITGILVDYSFRDEVSESGRNMFRQRLMSCLNYITAKDPQPALHPAATVLMVQDLGVGKLNAETAILDSVKRGSKLLKDIDVELGSMKDDANSKTLEAFKLLLAFALLQAYFGEAESFNIIDDLQGFYRSTLKRKTSRSEQDMVALVEIIVEFVSKPSALYRRLAPKILRSFANRVDEDGLSAMTGVLLTTEDSSGQAELFAAADEIAMNAVGSEENGEDSGSDDSDVEMVDRANSRNDASEVSSGSDTSSSSGSDDASGAGDEDAELAAFDAQLAAALRTSHPDLDAESDSDSDMSDSQMEALDAQIGQIFRHRLQDSKTQQTPKQQRRGTRDTIVNFKTKILELLETYVKAEARKPAAISIVVPLLESMRMTSNRNVAQKTCDLVRQMMRLYKLRPLGTKDDDDVDNDATAKRSPQSAWEVLERAHELAHSTTSQAQAKACSSASLLATKAFLTSGGPLKDVKAKYAATQVTLEAKKENKFRACLMEDWENWLVQADKEGQLEGR